MFRRKYLIVEEFLRAKIRSTLIKLIEDALYLLSHPINCLNMKAVAKINGKTFV